MKILLDTHTFLWFCEDDKELAVKAKAAIEDASNKFYLSCVSLWEITIKLQLQKLTLNKTLAEVIKYLPLQGFQYLDIKPVHLLKRSNLGAGHKDPFDRMLIAQAIAEDMIFITRDENIWQYPSVKLLW